MQVALKTLGCRLNEAELEGWGREFMERGHQLTNNLADADLVVINTCAVTREAVRKSCQLIRRSRRHNPDARLVVSGCYASLDTQFGTEIDGIDLLVENRNKDQLVELVHESLDIDNIPVDTSTLAGASLFPTGRNRAFVKVQDGCRYRCTFCLVTTARGDERSKPAARVINEINILHDAGINEVVLTGVHLGGYGSDRDSNLSGLLRSVLEQTSIPRIRLGSVEPWDMGDDFLPLFRNARLMPHLHLPMQSGSERILRRMARRCKPADFLTLLKTARAEIRDFNVTTDIITGFPGETDSDWDKTMAFVEACNFSHVHVFPYSVRSGTRAASMPDHVPVHVRKARSRELQMLAMRLKRDCAATFLGRTLPVLIENDSRVISGERYLQGYTPGYLRVAVPFRETGSVSNVIVPVQMSALCEQTGLLLGRICG